MVIHFESELYICRSSQSGSGLRLTGDPQADADIMAFVKARQNILQQSEFLFLNCLNMHFS